MRRLVAAWFVLLCLFAEPVLAQSAVERNTSAQGTTPVGEYRGIPGMQDNEPSCAINPILPRNIVCAWNASGGSDDLIGDTWVRVSESLDAGETFNNRYINGSALDPATDIGQQFASDPIMICWPGGCGAVIIASTRAPGGGAGGGIYMQLMPDTNTETGFRHALAENLTPVYQSAPDLFADKPFALYMLDEDNPGTVPVSITIEAPGGGTQVITRDWPKARILVAFALGDPAGDEIRILSTYTDDYGATWSGPKTLTKRKYWEAGCDNDDDSDSDRQCKKRAGLNQGINISAMGDTVLYTYRVFEDETLPSAIKGVVSTNRGRTVGKAFDIVSPFCAYDVPTLPTASNTTTAAARTNAFPWISNNGNKFVMLYAERKPSSDGGCFTTFDAPTDSRIKAVVGSANGKTWSAPVEIAPNAEHGFQFQPVVDCSLGICQAAWWDSRFDSERVTNFLQNVSTSPMRAEALQAFLNLPVLGDFNFATGPTSVLQFRRTARILTTKLEIDSGTAVATDTPPVIVSQYRRALVDGEVREVQRDGWNIKAYRTSTVPFMGDYSWLTSAKLRLAFDPANPSAQPLWESNASPDVQNPDRDPQFWISFVTSRNVRGDIYTARITDPVPYERTPDAAVVRQNDSKEGGTDPASVDGSTANANNLEDFNAGAGFCAPTGNPGPGVVFDALNNRTKDFDIYGALIENEVSAFSLNPTKTFNIQRSYTVVVENESEGTKSFRLVISNQPAGFPGAARASWDQLPFDPAEPDFATTDPATIRTIDVGPQSSESLAVFVVSAETVNPVRVDVFEELGGGSDRFVNSITVNGTSEDGAFLNADGTVNNFEIHNPRVYFPDEFNPDEFNPDEYNPDEFNPDVYTPDEFNPDEFNPDEFNPDEFNPDEFNPDEFNPDEFNPDEFNPDEFNPDEFNAPLIDPGKLDNPEIPDPDLGAIMGLVSKLDINYGVQNIGNTTTPYTADFQVTDPEVLALLESGDLVAQLIAWQDKKVDDVQFCAPREISENRILAAVNNPDLTVLLVPDISNNRFGSITFTAAPGDVVQLTLRFIATRDTLIGIADKLSSSKISSVFASQVANTGSDTLFPDETLIIDDRTPPDFNFTTGDTTTFEAEGPAGALIPASLVTASRDGEPVPVVCDPALPAQVGLDIFNAPAGPTELNCTATTENGVTAELQLMVSVLDTTAPTVDAGSVPADIVAEASGPGGASTTYILPSATDANGVDPDVDVVCSPASGSDFPFTPPGPTVTTVTCTATDDSFLTDTATFDVSVEDTTAPVITLVGDTTVTVEAGTDFVDPGASAADVADPGVAVTTDSSAVDTSTVGTYVVTYNAVDASFNAAAEVTRTVIVEDTTSPVIGGLNPPDFEPPLIDRFVLDDDKSSFLLFWGPFDVTDADAAPTVDCSVGMLDADRSDPENGLYTFVYDFPVGSTLVECTASDESGNSSSGSFTVDIFDETPPVVTLVGDDVITIDGGEPYVDPGVTATDNVDGDISANVVIDDSEIDLENSGTYTVFLSVADSSGNETTLTRTVIVDRFRYAGGWGIHPSRTSTRVGKTVYLYWAWLDENGHRVNSSGDPHSIRIEKCDTGEVVLEASGLPGQDNLYYWGWYNKWKYRWRTGGFAKGHYCAFATSGLSGQELSSPPIRLK